MAQQVGSDVLRRRFPAARRFVLLDRDGTLVESVPYLSDPDQLRLLPGAGEALRLLRDAGLGLAVVTNQSAIGRGYFDLGRLDEVHTRLIDVLAAERVHLDGIYVCPHLPDDDCACRKPRPGLALQAARELGFVPSASFVVGDNLADVELGPALGATTFLVRTGYGAELEREGRARGATVVDDLLAAAVAIRTVLG